MSELKGPEITIPLGSKKDVGCGKYLHLDISAQAQIKNCKISVGGSEKPDPKVTVTTATEQWFKKIGKGEIHFEGKPFGDFVMEKPHVGTDGFDVKLKASSKGGEIVLDLKFVDLTAGKQDIQIPHGAKWPKYELEETVKSCKVTADLYPVIVAVGHPQYKEILIEAGVQGMKTKLGKQAAEALVKTLARYGLNDLAAAVQAAAGELAAAGEAGGGGAVLLTPVTAAAAAVAAVILSGAWAWKYHSDTQKVTAAKGEVAHLATRLWEGFQFGVLGHSAPSDEGKEAYPLGIKARQQMIAEIHKQKKNASQKEVDDAIQHATAQMFNDGKYFAALKLKAQNEVWEDCKTNLAPYWLNGQPDRLKEAYINVFGSESGYEAAVKGLHPKKG